MKLCSNCKEWKTANDFHKNKCARDGLNGHCKQCHNDKARIRWKENPKYRDSVRAAKQRMKDRLRDIVAKYLKSHPCLCCGEENWLVLEFDHKDPEDKAREIARFINDGCRVDRLSLEISKCDVLCANCHRLKTLKQSNSWRIQ